jgi:hypothetical protein
VFQPSTPAISTSTLTEQMVSFGWFHGGFLLGGCTMDTECGFSTFLVFATIFAYRSTSLFTFRPHNPFFNNNNKFIEGPIQCLGFFHQ